MWTDHISGWTEDELYILQIVSPNRLATLRTVNSGKLLSGWIGIVLVTMTCTDMEKLVRLLMTLQLSKVRMLEVNSSESKTQGKKATIQGSTQYSRSSAHKQ